MSGIEQDNIVEEPVGELPIEVSTEEPAVAEPVAESDSSVPLHEITPAFQDMHDDDDDDVEEFPSDDADLYEAYEAIYDDILDMVKIGGVDEMNVTSIIAAVMEAIDALGQSMEWDGREKARKAKLLAKRILTHLKMEGHMTPELHRDFMTALNISSLVMFALPILADKGKIIFQHVKSGVQRACVRCKNRNAVKMDKSRKLRQRKKNLDQMARARSTPGAVEAADQGCVCNNCCCVNDKCGRCCTM